MHQVVLALQSYQEVNHGAYPLSAYRDQRGIAIYSWRLAVVRFIADLPYDQYVSWNSPTNIHLKDTVVPSFCSQYTSGTNSPMSTVFAVVGEDTPLGTRRSYRENDVSANLILVVECGQMNVHWAEPGDLDLDNLPSGISKGLDGGGFFVGFSDGSVWFIRKDVPLDRFRKLLTVTSAKNSNREQVLGPFATKYTFHQ